MRLDSRSVDPFEKHWRGFQRGHHVDCFNLSFSTDREALLWWGVGTGKALCVQHGGGGVACASSLRACSFETLALLTFPLQPCRIHTFSSCIPEAQCVGEEVTRTLRAHGLVWCPRSVPKCKYRILFHLFWLSFVLCSQPIVGT